MAIVGSAHVIIRAITDKLQGDINKALKDSIPGSKKAGEDAGKAYADGFARNAKIDGSQMFSGVNTAAQQAATSAKTALSSIGDERVRVDFDVDSDPLQAVRRNMSSQGPALANAAGGIGNRVSNSFTSGFQRGGAARTFGSIALRIGALIPLIGALVGAISSLVSGLFAVASAAGAAANSLAVLPAMLGAVIQGGAVMATAFNGLGPAISAGMEAAKKSTGGATKELKQNATGAARAVGDAMRGLADAQEQAADMIKGALRGVRDAKENLARTYVSAARASRDAAESVRDAEDALRESHDRVREAQEALTQARVEAKERLIDLQFANESGALAEQRAMFALRDARYELNAASELPADNRIRQEAELAFKEADLNYRMIVERNGDNTKELKKFRDEGVNGSEEVVAAQDNLRDAQDGVREAAEGLNDALRNQRQVHQDNAQAIRDSKQALADAKSALSDAYEDAPQIVADARRALQDARRAAGEASAEFAAGAPAIQTYQDELSKLSPVAQRFVKYIVSLKDELGRLKAAAQESLLPGLEVAIDRVVTKLFPTLETGIRQTGSAIADAANSISRDITSGPFTESFANVMRNNSVTIRRLGLVFGDLARVMVTLLDAARPLINQFTNWLVSWSDNLRVTTEAKNRTGELGDAFEKAGNRAKLLIRITKNIIEGFFDLGNMAEPAGLRLLRSFETATKAFADFTDTKENRRMLRDFFDDVATNVEALASLAKVAGGAFARLGANPAIGKLATALEPTIIKIEKLINTLLEETGTDIIRAINSIIDAFRALADGPALKVFLGIFIVFFKSLTALLNTPILGDFIKAIIAVKAAMFAISIISRFPGLAMLANMLIFNRKWFMLMRASILLNFAALRLIAGAAIKTAAAFVWTKTIAIAQRAWAAATTAVATAQLLLNAAMRANPIGVVITALVAIGAALVLAYNKFDGFRKVVDAVFRAVADAAIWLWDVLFGHSVFPDMLKAFDRIFTAIGKVIKWAWNSVILPVFRAMMRFVKGVLVPVVKILANVFKAVFSAIVRVIKFAWNNVIKPIWTLIKIYLTRVLFPIFRFLFNNVVKPVFIAIGKIIKTAWNNVIKPIWTAIKVYIDRVLKPIFNFLWQKVIKPIWTSIGGKIKDVWQNVIKPVFEALKNFLKDKVQPAFRQAVDKIGDIWNSLKKAAAAPVNFVIKTVYNNGLRKALNLIPGVNLGEARGISFATGGVMPGYTPGRDVHKFYSPTGGRLELSGGEAIMRPEFTRLVGGEQGVNILNRLARQGKRPILGGHQHAGYYASGGVLRFASGGVNPMPGGALTNRHPNGYQGSSFAGDYNGPGGGNTDLGYKVVAYKAGRVSAVRIPNPKDDGSYGPNVIIDHGSSWSRYAHLNTIVARIGQQVAAGTKIGTVGNYGNTGGLAHLHFEIHGGGAAPSGGGKAGPSPKEIATEKAEEDKDNWLEIAGNIKDAFGNVKNGISSMANNGGWWPMMASAARAAARDAVQWANDRIPNDIELPGPVPGSIPMLDNPIPNPFDTGGLARGRGWMKKDVIGPERILSPRQTQSFERLIEVLDKRGTVSSTLGDPDINLTVHVPQEASARDVVDGIVYEMKRMKRGGIYNR